MKEFYLEIAAAGGLTFRTGVSLRNSLLGLPHSTENLVVLQLPQSQILHILEKLELPVIHNSSTEIATETLQIRVLQNIQELNEQVDFTIHNIFVNALTDSVYDPFHGILDLRNKVIRTTKQVFLGSPVKMVEACRLVSELGFTIHVETWFELYNNARVVQHTVPDLIREELSKILMLTKPSVVFEQLQETRLLEYIIPELARCQPVIQSKRSGVKNVFEHIMYALDACERRLDLRLVILFHDIAKPQTLHCDADGTIHFFKHEIYGAKIAKSYLKYWNFPKDIIHNVAHLILNHMFDADPKMVDKTVKRLIRKVGKEHIFDLLKIREADRGGTSEKVSMKKVKLLRKKIERILNDESDRTLGPNSAGSNGNISNERKEEAGQQPAESAGAIHAAAQPEEVVGNAPGTNSGTDSTVS
jgi:tRNA nucleotidyltransferase (CCA-adding enzyme)